MCVCAIINHSSLIYLASVILADLVVGRVLLEREAGALDGGGVEVAHLGAGRGGGGGLRCVCKLDVKARFRARRQLCTCAWVRTRGVRTYQQAKDDGGEEAGHGGAGVGDWTEARRPVCGSGGWSRAEMCQRLAMLDRMPDSGGRAGTWHAVLPPFSIITLPAGVLRWPTAPGDEREGSIGVGHRGV